MPDTPKAGATALTGQCFSITRWTSMARLRGVVWASLRDVHPAISFDVGRLAPTSFSDSVRVSKPHGNHR
ncbi:MAG: hypothetical protein ABI593_06640 [Betaproteobacteria bacterium]